MKLGVTEYIDCAHHLPGHERCGSLHGHTYQVDVFIEGDHKGGMLLDFADLKKNLRSVLADYDHKDWNTFLEYPTVENICELITKRLNERIKFPLHVRVWEGYGKWAEICCGRPAPLRETHGLRFPARSRRDPSSPRPVQREAGTPQGRGRVASEGGARIPRLERQ